MAGENVKSDLAFNKSWRKKSKKVEQCESEIQNEATHNIELSVKCVEEMKSERAFAKSSQSEKLKSLSLKMKQDVKFERGRGEEWTGIQ